MQPSRPPQGADARTIVRPNLSGAVLLAALLAAVVGLALTGDGRADFIFLKDGFVLQGKVSREGKTVVDPIGKQGVWMPQGFYWVDNGLQRIAFSPGQVQALDARDYNPEHDINSPRTYVGSTGLPPLREVVSTGAWDDKWDRAIRVRCIVNNASREIALVQHLHMLTPQFARIDTLGFNYRWTLCLPTRELGPEAVRTLIANHPEFKETPGLAEEAIAAKRFRAFHFLVQAGWYDVAEKDLERILKDLPKQKEKVETARQGLKRLRAVQLADDIKRADAAGQHRWVQRQLTDFTGEGVSERTLGELRVLRDKYEKGTEALKQARRLLQELPKAVTVEAQRMLFAEAARAIDAELDYDTIDRLESFLSQAAQAERQRQQKQAPEQGPAELLSLAVSGWLLGNTSAEAKVEVAERLWRARQLALKYEQTADRGDRKKLLENYLAQKAGVIGVDEMAQLLTQLPPPEPEEKIGSVPLKLETKPLERRRSVSYQLQLPPEYHHGRAYPVLIVLHQGGESAREMLERWSDAAGRHGYVLAAPEWGQGIKSTYNYTPEEHAVVLDVLRDLRRRLRIDSDRVFLFGLGEGASMAYDVGLSHPDFFAGVLPMCGQPVQFAQRYSRNAQYLPFYVTSGDHSGTPHLMNRRQFEDWVPKGYPSIFVECRGRGVEWFGNEVPSMFEWMKHKKRMMPTSEVGAQGREFQTMREGDNSFYWLSTSSISPAHLNDAARWNPAILAATLFAHVNRENNQITIRTVGLRQLTISLGRDSKGASMVDFGAAVTVAINGQLKMSGRVMPSMETLLEDFHQRGDRQRLFLAKLEFSKL